MTCSQKAFVSILRTNSSTGIRIGYEVEPEDHISTRLLGLYDGLRFIFEGYKPRDPLALNTPLLINDHFKQLSDRLGFQIMPPEGLVSNIGYELLDGHKTNSAVECFELNVKNYPDWAYGYRDLANAYVAKGEKTLAIRTYEKALELDPNTYGVKRALRKLR
jgi:tetratricopeptide (TPR) repeat protein